MNRIIYDSIYDIYALVYDTFDSLYTPIDEDILIDNFPWLIDDYE
jgi:hypothetical protein